MSIEWDFMSDSEKHIRLVLDTLIKEYGMLEILRQIETLCRKRAEKLSSENAEDCLAAADGVHMAWNRLNFSLSRNLDGTSD